MAVKPFCFVIMPFGSKKDPSGRPDIDFDAIYNKGIKPAVEAAGMEPIRADEERMGGIIHKPMFERLMFCEFAIADLTTANANVLYELGIRHAVLPKTTVPIFAEGHPMPFDVALIRALPYKLGKNNGFPKARADALKKALTKKLKDVRALARSEDTQDSPVFQLIQGWKTPDLIAHLKTDVFRERAEMNKKHKAALEKICARANDGTQGGRAQALKDLARFKKTNMKVADAVDAATHVNVMLAHRALEDWAGMIDAYEAMSGELQRQVMVREQLGFAYNRLAKDTEAQTYRATALRILADVEADQGPSSETSGLIGRIHKDYWEHYSEAGDDARATAHLDRSIDAYRQGVMADQRDPYPGVNLVTLLEVRGDAASLKEKAEMQPVVQFAVERNLETHKPDYWDHATRLELAVLDNDHPGAARHLGDAKVMITESWQPKTTVKNLGFIRDARRKRGDDVKWIDKIIKALKPREDADKNKKSGKKAGKKGSAKKRRT
jgi:hypothetical protein